MTPAALLPELDRWRQAGWLRSLDVAFARFIHETDPGAPASLLLAAALAAQLEGRGHSGLPLAELAADAEALLGWPAEGNAALRLALADRPGRVGDGPRRRVKVDASQLSLWPERSASPAGSHSSHSSLWSSRPVLEIDPADDQGSSPLVLSRGLLYLRRYWRYEARVAAQIHARTQTPADSAIAPHDIDDDSGIDAAAARELLDRLFGPNQADGAVPATDWQKVACALALRGRLTIITGGPGTGKTYTAARLLVLLQALHAAKAGNAGSAASTANAAYAIHAANATDPGSAANAPNTTPQPLRVALAAPTGKAAARLRQAIRQALQGLREQPGSAGAVGAWADSLASARTLHALLGTQTGTRRFRHDAANPLEVDVLFVDEASMVHLEMMAQLLEALPPGARLVLLGDKDQLASVEAGAVMADLCQGANNGYTPGTAAWVRRLTGQALPAPSLGQGPALAQQTVVLRKSHRFDGPIGRLALAVNRGDAAAAVAMLRADAEGPVALRLTPSASALLPWAVNGRPGAPGGYRSYLELLPQRPGDAGAFAAWAQALLRRFDSLRVLSAVREGPWGVAGLNDAIERALAEAGLLSRRGEWYEGRPVMVTRNDAALGVFNGDVGVVLRAPTGDGALRCWFLDGDELRSVAAGRLADVETAFAMTVHKSQGSEFEHVLLVLPDEDVPVLTREWLYTGITRASRAFTLCGKQLAPLEAATGRLTRRVSGLRAML